RNLGARSLATQHAARLSVHSPVDASARASESEPPSAPAAFLQRSAAAAALPLQEPEPRLHLKPHSPTLPLAHPVMLQRILLRAIALPAILLQETAQSHPLPGTHREPDAAQARSNACRSDGSASRLPGSMLYKTGNPFLTSC